MRYTDARFWRAQERQQRALVAGIRKTFPIIFLCLFLIGFFI